MKSGNKIPQGVQGMQGMQASSKTANSQHPATQQQKQAAAARRNGRQLQGNRGQQPQSKLG